MECPVCSYKQSDPLLRCPSCSSLFAAPELEELHHLRYLQLRLQTWQAHGVLDAPAFAEVIAQARREIDRLQERLGVSPLVQAEPPAAPVEPAPPPQAPPELVVQQAQVAARPPQELFPPKEAPSISWSKMGEALLSRHALQTFLYLGATLLVLSAIILVVQLWEDLHWVIRQAMLLAGMAALLWSGFQVREKMGLRVSGGALMDIGALWIPLNVGALLFEFLEVEAGATIPGLGIPLGLHMGGWMAIAAISTPVYAFLAYRFRLVLMLYGAAIGAGATLLTGLAALGVPLEWQLTSIILLGPAYLWVSNALRRKDLTDLEPHLFWLVQAAVPSLLATVVGLVAAEDGSQEAVTVAAWSALLFYGVSFVLYRHLAFEYLAIIGLPAALLATLALHVPALPLAWYNLALVGAAAAYVAVGKYLRRSPLWARSDDPALAVAGVRVEPLYVVSLALTVAAVVWPATVPSATVSLYSLVVVYAAAARLFEQRALAYVASALLFAPFALTIHWLEVDSHWRALLFAPLAAAYLAAAEIDAARHGERGLPVRQLLNLAAPLKALYARPLFLAGYAATAVAVVFAATDLISFTDAGQTTIWDFIGGTAAPWTYLSVAGIYAASAYLRRSSIFVHLAAWLTLPFALLLMERGFYAGWTFEGPDYALLMGGLSLVYLALGLALDRVGGHYSKGLYLVGYSLTVVGMVGTAQVKEFSLAMVGMSVAVYAASAFWVHQGGHPAFRWLIDQLFPKDGDLGRRVARGTFLYLATGLFPVAVLLAISRAEPETAWYGVALTSIAAVYVVIAELFRYSDPVYRNQWYVFGLGLSVIGPIITLADPTLRIATLAISTTRYAASAVITRRPLWVYPVAALLPLLLILGMDRAEVASSYYGVALVALTVAYGAAGLMWRPDGLELVTRPQTGRPGSFTLPFFVVGFLVSIVGIGMSTVESRGFIVSALSVGAVFYLLATISLRQTLLLYPVAALLAAAYGVGLTLTDIDSRYYGLALLPGVLVALTAAMILEGHPDAYRPARWFLRRPTGELSTPRSGLSFYSPMLPFSLVAYAGSVAVPALSIGEGWLLFWGLVASTAIYAYSAWRFRAPLWSYPALLTAHIALVRMMFLLSPNIPWHQVGAYLIPAVFLVAGLAVLALKVQGRMSVSSTQTSPANLERLSRDWALPFVGFATLGVVFSTALASIEGSTGLIAGLAYGVALGVGASLARRQSLAWASLLFLALALAQEMRLAEVPLLDTPIFVALAGVALVVTSYSIRQMGAVVSNRPADSPSPWGIWYVPVKAFAYLATGVAPVLALASWLAEGAVADDLQPLVFTLAINGLALVGMAYLERRTWLTYLAVSMLEAAYMVQLVVFDAGQPQFFVVPAALYLVAVAYLERSRWNRAPVVLLETAGLALLLGITLMQALGLFTDDVDHQIYSLVLFFESLGVVLWGLLVRWKRPFFGGIAAFIANLAILLFDPLGEGPVSATILWSVFGAVGTALIGGAVYLERNRERSSAALRSMIDRLETWD